jgi:eukaryotic-like serine/threonine-protein kinase
MGAVEAEGNGRHVTGREILFEKFEVISCLKQDEYSSVYLARHIYLGKNIILKALCTERIPDTVLVDRFKREARILARLDHPNIIKVLDFGTFKEFFYISFEYFKSHNLRQALRSQVLSHSLKRKIFIDLLEAIRYAHSEGVIHRDIKPENILVNEALDVKLSDFGLAQMHTDSLVTDKLGLVGTPSYMSPEQIQGEVLTPQSDLFSCGIVACELFLNVHPFLGRDVNESLNTIISFNERDILVRLKPLAEDVRSVIEKLLKKKPNERWESASAVLEALGVSSISVGKNVNQSNRFARPLMISVMIIVVLACALVIYLANRNDSDLVALPVPAKDTSDSIAKTPGPLQPALSDQKKKAEPPLREASTEKKVQGKQVVAEAALQKKNSTAENANPPIARYGELSVACLPWAQIRIDSFDVETTPLKNNLKLPVGAHQLELFHPGYPVYRSRIDIMPGEVATIKVNLDTLFGFLACNVFPWGELYIDGKYIDRTPIKPIRLIPGDYRIVIKNVELGEIEKKVTILQHDTLRLQHRFGSQQ